MRCVVLGTQLWFFGSLACAAAACGAHVPAPGDGASGLEREVGAGETGADEVGVDAGAPEGGRPVEPGPWPPFDCMEVDGTISCGGGMRIGPLSCGGHTFATDVPFMGLSLAGLTLRAPGTCAGAAHCGHVVVRADGARCNRTGRPYNCVLAIGAGSTEGLCEQSWPSDRPGVVLFRPSMSPCAPAWTYANPFGFDLDVELVADDGSSFSPPLVVKRTCSWWSGT